MDALFLPFLDPVTGKSMFVDLRSLDSADEDDPSALWCYCQQKYDARKAILRCSTDKCPGMGWIHPSA